LIWIAAMIGMLTPCVRMFSGASYRVEVPVMRSSFIIVTAISISCSSDKGIAIHNSAPEVIIYGPDDESEHWTGDTIDFIAQIGDDRDDATSLIRVWRSDVQGSFEDTSTVSADGGVTWSTSQLETGSHTVSLQVIDSEGLTNSASVRVTVEDPDFRPRITMLHPTGTESGEAGIPFEFMAEVHDGQDAPELLDIVFFSSEDGEICSPTADSDGIAVCSEALTEGTHFLEFSVTDTEGNSNLEPELWNFTVEPFDHDDADGDGYTENDNDCNDDDFYVNPAATEVPYDGIDQDCDGEDLTDADGDGHDAMVAGGDDCMDTDPDSYPGAIEVCDSVDNNCDGTVDEEDATGCEQWYLDEDDDGYGVGIDDSKCLCGPSGDYDADNVDDCDDSDASVNPGYEGWATFETEAGSWDWNCDGDEEEESVGFGSCSDSSICSLASTGWGGALPACGESGFWVTDCDGFAFTCEESGETKVQRCR